MEQQRKYSANVYATSVVYEVLCSCRRIWISTQKSLETLDLSENQLEGMFPQWLAEMEVHIIILSSNSLTGSLPPRLFDSQNLLDLNLSQNNFYGELPNNIGNVTLLKFLALDGNNFLGKIPKSISINEFTLLDLSSNRLSGELNSSLFASFMDVSSNQFKNFPHDDQ